MTSDITKFDPATLMQGVRDRIKATFVSLIPEEQWESLVQKEVEAFFAVKQISSDGKKYHSEFTGICFEILTEWSKTHLKTVLEKYQSEFWQNDVLTGSHAPSQLLKDL